MPSRAFLRLYLLHALPMLLALLAGVMVARWMQLERALPVVVCGIVFSGLAGAIKNAYRAGQEQERASS